MYTKPEACRGCPFYALSQYITPDVMIDDAEVLILAQAPGEYEEQGIKLIRRNYGQEVTEKTHPQPLIGPTGQWLQTEFWPLTRIDYTKVSKANVIKCRPYNKNELPNIGSTKAVNGISVKMLKEAITHCTNTYLHTPKSTKYVMAMGGISLYALTKQESITNWRGWCVGSHSLNTMYGIDDYYQPTWDKLNIFPVIHIAALFQSDKYYHATLCDFVRFGQLVRRDWPIVLPEIQVNVIPQTVPSTIGFDTEYDVSDNNRLLMWSMADVKGNVYVNDAGMVTKLPWVYTTLTLVTQNGLVDMPHILPMLYKPDDVIVEDCMLAHAVLWSGELNSLDYMLSKVGRYNRHKHLRETQDKHLKYLYAGLDAHTTLNDAWYSLIQEFKQDHLSYQEYRLRRRTLLPIINKSHQRGIEVFTERVQYISEMLDAEMADIIERAKQVTENPDFNIASPDQVSMALYEKVYISAKKVVARATPKKSVDKQLQDIIAQINLELGV